MKKYLQSSYFLSFILGALSASSLAPTYLFFAAIIGISGLFLILNNSQNNKSSFLIGWNFGFGYFVIGLYWISISLFTDFAKFGWLLPFSATLIPAAMAIYIGLSALLTNYLTRIFNLNISKKLFLFALIWTIFEYLRSVLFTGFPWNSIGYILGFSDKLIQSASIFGIHGLDFLAISICAAPALVFKIENHKLKFDYQFPKFLTFLAIIILFTTNLIYGQIRLNNAKLSLVKNGNLRLVQPNIKQDEKWDSELRYKSFFENIKLTNSKDLQNINYIIWSERAIPFILNDNYPLLNQISKAAPANGFVVSGALHGEFSNSEKTELEKIWNSVFVIDDKANIKALYDKNHLVPFGEYIPFQKYLPFISKITEGSIGFSEGSERHEIKPSANLPSFSPLICYEVIFTNIIDKNNQADFLINVTNDAWFGISSGPYQHLAMAKIRAVEYGLPIARVANSGISALIDPYGRIVDKINLNQKGILDVKLMQKLRATFYHKYGIILPLILGLIILFLIFLKISRFLLKPLK